MENKVIEKVSCTNEIDLKKAITVQQLPVIADMLQAISTKWNEELKSVENIECTEETRTAVEKIRANFTKQYNTLNDAYRDVINKVEQPIKDFKSKFDTLLKIPYQTSDEKLKKKILEVKQGIIDKTTEIVKEAFKSNVEMTGYDWLKFEDLGLKIVMSSDINNLLKQVAFAFQKITEDLFIIKNQKFAEEIEIVYRTNGRNVAEAINTVVEREEQKAKLIEANRIREERKLELKRMKSEVEIPTYREMDEGVVQVEEQPKVEVHQEITSPSVQQKWKPFYLLLDKSKFDLLKDFCKENKIQIRKIEEKDIRQGE